MTQEELLQLIKSDTEKGMQAILKQYSALVYKIAWSKLSSVCTAQDIEETVSDIFIEFYKRIEVIDLTKGSLTSFIMLLAQRRSVDAFRKFTRQQYMYSLVENTVAESELTEDTILRNEDRQALFDSILELGEPDSTIIFRKYYFGETYEEIGKRLSMTANAVNKRCLRAIDRLRLMMKGEIIGD
ncbi:MAG: sigma-70 family RNA polymerase sigma factor [Clostridia bacterium]|nr:sigma-70 family RNA polymerase sigma factor [Clostridia bacterium]